MKLTSGHLLVAVLALLALPLAGCAQTRSAAPSGTSYGKAAGGSGTSKNVGTYKVGTPYKVSSVWYHPREEFKYAETGVASWYGPNFHGKRTANGETYNQHAMTAAHRTLQMPSVVRVTNLENNRSVVVRVNDRGPFKSGRIIDLSKAAAEQLDMIRSGTAKVRVELLEQESRKIAVLAQQGQDTSRVNLASLRGSPAPVRQDGLINTRPLQRGPQYASLKNDAEALPESLQTPTITVEELNMPGQPSSTQQRPRWQAAPAAQPRPQPAPVATAPLPAPVIPAYTPPPAPAPVTAATYAPAGGLYVQAGAFAVKDNADKLQSRLAPIGPVVVDPVHTSGGRVLYRVRIGPMSSRGAAENALTQVVAAGLGSAHIVGQ